MSIKPYEIVNGLIKTIEDDDDVEDFSGESDVEVHFQPTKLKATKPTDFDADFQFVANVAEYNTNTWDDLGKYVKRKVKTKTDDKIKKARECIVAEAEEETNEKSEDELSNTELKHDNIKEKTNSLKKKKKKKKVNPDMEADNDDGDVVEGDDYFELAPAFDDSITFQQMNLSRPLMKAISDMKFVHPTPIQAATIPPALLGKDICGCAATGTGKTAAYMLPALERLLYRPKTGQPMTRVLVLVPTRELGVQVYTVTKQIAQHTDVRIGLAVGGLDVKRQEAILRKLPDVVIATPGRLIDHLKSTPTFNLDTIEILVLDEADRMLDSYFAEQMKEIVKRCSRTRQTILFSATMTDAVADLTAVTLNKPLRLFVDGNKEVAFNLRQEFVRVRQEADRDVYLIALIKRTFRTRCIIFVRTKRCAHRLHIVLGLFGLKAAELHGDLAQPQRLDALARFRDQQVDYLISTDVAARGLDIPHVTTVINYNMPLTVEHYIHRVGRTARAGRAGVSVSLAGDDDRKIVKTIVKSARQPVKTRLIALDVLTKYKERLAELEPKVQEILAEEKEERMLSKLENRTNRLERLLNGEATPSSEREREWFQSKVERKQEADRLKQTYNEMLKTKTKDAKKTKKRQQKKDVVEPGLKRQLAIQARTSKRSAKPKRINTCVEERTDGGTRANGGRKRKSNFADDLCNVGSKRTKSLRYEASFKQKQKAKNKKKGTGDGKSKKVFGRPQQKKVKNRRQK